MSYSTSTEFGLLGISAAWLAGRSASEQTEWLASGYDRVNGYFRAANIPVPVPAAYVGHDTKQAECAIAAWTGVTVVGFDPNSEADKALEKAYEMAIQWLRDVAKGLVKPFPAELTDTISESEEAGAYAVESDDPRGW